MSFTNKYILIAVRLLLLTVLFYSISLKSLDVGHIKIYLLGKAIIFIFIGEQFIRLFKFLIYSSFSEHKKNIFFSITIFIFIFFFVETVFTFIPKSRGNGNVYSAKLWFSYYWNPINKYGFRDNEIEKNIKNNIFFIGDSFTAGQGIKNINDRFSAVATKNLNDYQSVNISKCGINTVQEYKSLINFIEMSGIMPNKIILQYFGNDIQISKTNNVKPTVNLAENESNKRTITEIKRTIIEILFDKSCLFNYFYSLKPRTNIATYINDLTYEYKNDKSFKKHLDEVDMFIEFSKKHNLELVVVIFPFLHDIEMSQQLYINKLIKFLNKNTIQYIDVSNLISQLSLKERFINYNDGHPSKKVHNIVGFELSKHLSK